MTPTIGFQMRLDQELHMAMETAIERGKRNEYIRGLIRKDLIRRGALPKPEDPPLLALAERRARRGGR